MQHNFQGRGNRVITTGEEHEAAITSGSSHSKTQFEVVFYFRLMFSIHANGLRKNEKHSQIVHDAGSKHWNGEREANLFL